jgi:hypothetical protein
VKPDVIIVCIELVGMSPFNILQCMVPHMIEQTNMIFSEIVSVLEVYLGNH